MITTCAIGHDLTQPGAYAYSSTNMRTCRACQQPAEKRRPKGQGFAPSWLNQYTSDKKGQ